MEFPLNRAPELFFDEQLWQIFVSYFETPEIALARIGYPPDLTGCHQEHFERRNSLSKEVWQEIEEAYAVGRELLRDLREKFLSEELTATGVPRGRSRPSRERVPTVEWKTLWPNFAGNWAMILGQRIAVTENGKTRRLPALEVMLRRLANDAMRGEPVALKSMLISRGKDSTVLSCTLTMSSGLSLLVIKC